MSDNFSFKLNIEDRLKQASHDLGNQNNEIIQSIDPNEIENWEYRDRQDFELGNIEDLARSIRENGQAQPIILVKSSTLFKSKNGGKAKYIVIAGYRRWLACKNIGCHVEAIVRNLNVNQAISCLVSENEKESISDYSKGVFYSHVLQNKALKKIDLYTKLGISKSALNNYLSFAEIPESIANAIGDFSKVSARTAYEIKRFSLKGDKYIETLIDIAPLIASGIGEKKLKNLLNKTMNKSIEKPELYVHKYNDLLAFKLKNNKLTFSNNIISSPKYDDLIKKIKEVTDDILASGERNE